MGLFDLFSNRQRKLRGDVPDVYIYNDIPRTLRVQIGYIGQDALGDSEKYNGQRRVVDAYKFIVETLCREYGVFRLISADDYGVRNYFLELYNFILQEKNHEKVLDSVEVLFQFIDRCTRGFEYVRRDNASECADAAIIELNARFKEHGVGFQFIDGNIIRIDSELIHTEVVKPALVLLHGREYAGAQSEFLRAHEHYRHGNAKEALNECLKALESTMKAICEKREWNHQANATCRALIQVCIDNNLIPEFWIQHFSALRSTIESGVPTARNKLGGHGQGSAVVDVPLHIVSYVLHMTAACIIFLVESERALA